MKNKEKQRAYLEEYKNIFLNSKIDPRASVCDIARAIIDGTPIPTVEKAMGHGSLQDNIKFLKEEEACRQMQEIAESVGVLPLKTTTCIIGKIGAKQPMKSQEQMDRDILLAEEKLGAYCSQVDFTGFISKDDSKCKTAEEKHLKEIQKSLEEELEEFFTKNKESYIPSKYQKAESVKQQINENKLDDSKKQGVKESDGKLEYELDWNFIEQMAQRMAQNKGKYEPFNWQKPMDVEKLKQSLLRHTIEIMKGNYADEGREFGHFESISLNSMMINYQLNNPKIKYKQEDFSNKNKTND